VQPHPPTRGNGERFLQVGPGPVQRACDPAQFRSGQQAARQYPLLSCLPQAIHRLLQVGRGLGEIVASLLPGLKQVGLPRERWSRAMSRSLPDSQPIV
jgi:hypothetical protein